MSGSTSLARSHPATKRTAVVVGTYTGSPWLQSSQAWMAAASDRDVLVHEGTPGTGYEPAALAWACTRLSRFLFLQDSVTILSETFWATVDNHAGPAWLSARPSMCMGIFNADELRPHLPTEPVDKAGSIAFENSLHERLDQPTLWPDVSDANALRTEHRHGRANLVLGVQGVWEKHKGTWR